ncbi:MAG: hypothetical protein FWG15_03430 [Propionibacteriaceae bacterium]|nr:hypothetical protein [Propionibacteriaceae bacterium]
MNDWSNILLATKALVDPATTSKDLMDIAQVHESLWTDIVAHPKADPTLLKWLAEEAYHPFIRTLALARLPLESQTEEPVVRVPLPFLGAGLPAATERRTPLVQSPPVVRPQAPKSSVLPKPVNPGQARTPAPNTAPAPTPVHPPAPTLARPPALKPATPTAAAPSRNPADFTPTVAIPVARPASTYADVDAPFIAPQPLRTKSGPSWIPLVAIGVGLGLLIGVIIILSNANSTMDPPTRNPTSTISNATATTAIVNPELTIDQFVYLLTGGPDNTGDRLWWQMSAVTQDFYGDYSIIASRLQNQAADYRGDGVPPADWPAGINYGTSSKGISAGATTSSENIGEVILRFFNSEDNAVGFSSGWAQASPLPDGMYRDSSIFAGVHVWWQANGEDAAFYHVTAQYGNVTATFETWEPLTQEELEEQLDLFRTAVDHAATQ